MGSADSIIVAFMITLCVVCIFVLLLCHGRFNRRLLRLLATTDHRTPHALKKMKEQQEKQQQCVPGVQLPKIQKPTCYGGENEQKMLPKLNYSTIGKTTFASDGPPV